VLGERSGRGVIETGGERHLEAEVLTQPCSELDGCQRLESEVREGRVEIHLGGVFTAEDLSHGLADEVE
jgi:hypothetical protein